MEEWRGKRREESKGEKKEEGLPQATFSFAHSTPEIGDCEPICPDSRFGHGQWESMALARPKVNHEDKLKPSSKTT